LISNPTARILLSQFYNKVLRIMFGSKKQEGGGWRKLHANNDDLRNHYASPNIISVIKSKKLS